MESNERYFARRAVEEYRAEARAVTPEAKARRRALAELFESKARLCRREMAQVHCEELVLTSTH
jgi:hypothetical protein